MTSRTNERFIAGGYHRARKATKPAIRTDVERAYAEQLRTAGWLRRWILRYRIQCEVERRLDEKCPPGALYISASALPRQPAPQPEPARQQD